VYLLTSAFEIKALKQNQKQEQHYLVDSYGAAGGRVAAAGDAAPVRPPERAVRAAAARAGHARRTSACLREGLRWAKTQMAKFFQPHTLSFATNVSD